LPALANHGGPAPHGRPAGKPFVNMRLPEHDHRVGRHLPQRVRRISCLTGQEDRQGRPQLIRMLTRRLPEECLGQPV